MLHFNRVDNDISRIQQTLISKKEKFTKIGLLKKLLPGSDRGGSQYQ